MLTPSDDFNTLGAAELRDELGDQHVYRVAPDPHDPDLLPPSREIGILADRSLTFAELDRQFAAGAQIVCRSADADHWSDGEPPIVPLAAVGPDGRLRFAADGLRPDVRADDTLIALVPPAGQP